MTELKAVQDPAPASPGDARNLTIIYVLYLFTFLVGVSALIGVVMAYVNKGTAPEWAETHYRYQIRTFWISLLYLLVGGLLVIAAVGFVVLLFWAVWFVVRCVKGLKQVQLGAPMPNPGTWLW
jgi:uncharacterized membrane protein